MEQSVGAHDHTRNVGHGAHTVDEVNEVLYRMREVAMPVNDALDAVWQLWLQTGSEEKAMAAITAAWTKHQDNLKTLRVAHEGALKYFVTIKNYMLKQIRSGRPPAGYPRPLPETLPKGLNA